MKDKILNIVREAMHTHLSWDYRLETIDGEDYCMEEISAELDKLFHKPTPVELTELDIAKMEACGFIYDKERNLMLRTWTHGDPDNNLTLSE